MSLFVQRSRDSSVDDDSFEDDKDLFEVVTSPSQSIRKNHHPWRRKAPLYRKSERNSSFSSDMVHVSDEEEEEEEEVEVVSHNDSTTEDESIFSDDQKDSNQPSLLSLPLVGSLNDYEDSGTSRESFQLDSTADEQRHTRLHHAGLILEEPPQQAPTPPVLDTATIPIEERRSSSGGFVQSKRDEEDDEEEEEEEDDDEFIKLSRQSLVNSTTTIESTLDNDHSGRYIPKNQPPPPPPPTHETSLPKPEFSWEKSDDSDLEDIVYEADSVADSQEGGETMVTNLLNIDLTKLSLPTLLTSDRAKPSHPPPTQRTRFPPPLRPPQDHDGPYDSGESITYETDELRPSVRSSSKASHDTTSSTATSVTPVDDWKHTGQVLNFAVEHRIFIKSMMELLGQQDKFATTADTNDPHTIKFGPLKKATHLVRGAWKNKYVEIRRGVFSYYDDAISKDEMGGDLMRKDISLHADTCRCRAVKVNTKSLTVPPGHAIFELSVEGAHRRFWMANSREERLSWIRAIQDAMIGNQAQSLGGRGGREASEHSGTGRRIARKSPYKRDLQIYLRVQRDIKNAASKQSYVAALSPLLGTTLNVPVKWITQQTGMLEETDRAFGDEGLSGGVHQLWKDLSRDTVSINGELIKGGSGHAPERIIGTLARAVMSMDRTSPLLCSQGEFSIHWVTELQAMSFARDILLSGNRTRSGGDSYFCVDALCQNQGLVVLVPNSLEAEPLRVVVNHIKLESGVGSFHCINDRSGWLKTRSRHQNQWKKRYFVLSEGTLSIYEMGSPRPHKFRGQIKIKGAVMKVTRVKLSTLSRGGRERRTPKKKKNDPQVYLISIRGKEGVTEREIVFENREKFLVWAYALEAMLRKKKNRRSSSDSPVVNGRKKGFRMRNKSDGGPTLAFVLAENSLQDHAAQLGLEGEDISSRVMALTNKFSSAGRTFSTLEASVEASTTYNICTTDPQGDDRDDTWAKVKATFTQHFRISGGPNGRLVRGEEVVKVNVVECGGEKSTTAMDLTLSPRSRSAFGRKLWRHGVD